MTRQTMQGRPWMCSGPRKGGLIMIEVAIGYTAMVAVALVSLVLFAASMGGPRV